MTVRDFVGTNDEIRSATATDGNIQAYIGNNNQSNALDNYGTKEYKATDEFKRIQEAVRGSGKEESSGRSVFTGYLEPNQRQRLADVLGRQLGSINSFIHGSSRDVTNAKHGTTFKMHSEVSPQLFHDVFEIVRYYTKNAELVDLHDDYSDCKCFLTEDGTAGFAVEPDGNLVSVFNLGTTKGFLSAIKDLVREAGATHLDAYASNKQNLEAMYAKTLGFHTASTMDYNMEYDHDDIAKNHGNPQVVFMVDHEVAEPKHFDKDSYDEAQNYQLKQLHFNEGKRQEEQQSSTVEQEDELDKLTEGTAEETSATTENSKEDKEIARLIKRQKEINRQMNELLTGGKFKDQVPKKFRDDIRIPSAELRKIANGLAYVVSEHITNIQEKGIDWVENEYQKKFRDEEDNPLNFASMERKDVINAISPLGVSSQQQVKYVCGTFSTYILSRGVRSSMGLFQKKFLRLDCLWDCSP